MGHSFLEMRIIKGKMYYCYLYEMETMPWFMNGGCSPDAHRTIRNNPRTNGRTFFMEVFFFIFFFFLDREGKQNTKKKLFYPFLPRSKNTHLFEWCIPRASRCIFRINCIHNFIIIIHEIIKTRRFITLFFLFSIELVFNYNYVFMINTYTVQHIRSCRSSSSFFFKIYIFN